MRKSRALELEFMIVLAFGGRHPDAMKNLETMVPKRLAKNAKLKAELAAAFDKCNGQSLPIDNSRLE